MNLWSVGRLDDAGFSSAALHGLFTALAAAAADGHRQHFVDRMLALSITLETEAWHPDPTWMWRSRFRG